SWWRAACSLISRRHGPFPDARERVVDGLTSRKTRRRRGDPAEPTQAERAASWAREAPGAQEPDTPTRAAGSGSPTGSSRTCPGGEAPSPRKKRHSDRIRMIVTMIALERHHSQMW